jgi:hypothetical protein
LALTVEDADYLGAGVLDALTERGAVVSLACLWNERGNGFDLDWADVAPIVQEYVEPPPSKLDHLVVVKSIISGACVVKTNIEHLFERMSPSQVHVAAPVMLDGAQLRLEEGFRPEIAALFRYWTFEIDNERLSSGEVVPGVGGEVYGRLGLGTKQTKNHFMPSLVKERYQSSV